jgi:Holliday junction resolvasome RuvABC endonuclease subunit
MNLLALDQSSTHVGYAIFKDGILAHWDEFKPDPPHYDALRTEVRRLILEHSIDTVVVETIYLAFFGGKVQAQVFKVLATVKAHIWAAARDAGCEVVEVSAYHAMKALTGITKVATKREVRKAAMIEGAFKLTGEVVSDHVADAVGLGLAYIQSLQVHVPQP